MALIRELRVVVVTLLNLVSSLKHVEAEDEHQHDDDPQHHGDQLVVTFVSFGTTALSFVSTMFGAGSAYEGAKKVMLRVSNAFAASVPVGRKVSVRSNSSSHKGNLEV